MENSIASLAYIRQIVEERKVLLAEAETELHASLLWQQARDRHEILNRAKDRQAEIETEVCKQALAIYEKTSNKSPHPGITIREATQADREWGIAPPDGQPFVNIARDLSIYLPGD